MVVAVVSLISLGGVRGRPRPAGMTPVVARSNRPRVLLAGESLSVIKSVPNSSSSSLSSRFWSRSTVSSVLDIVNLKWDCREERENKAN